MADKLAPAERAERVMISLPPALLARIDAMRVLGTHYASRSAWIAAAMDEAVSAVERNYGEAVED